MKKKKLKLYGMRKYWPELTEERAKEERQKLYIKQDGKCGICQKHEASFKIRLSVDHNHKTGQVRGLLCYYCNKFVVARHTLESATKLVKYLSIERDQQIEPDLSQVVCQHDDSSWCTIKCPTRKI